MAALYFISHGLYMAPDISDEGNIWVKGPTRSGVIVYSIITPIICAFGIFGNALSLTVLLRKELKGSIYVYLAVLAFSNLCTSILTFFGGLSRGIFFVDYWPILDAYLGVPIAQVFNCLTVMTAVAVMTDRILYLSNPTACNRPKYSTKKAKIFMSIALLIAIVSSLPYFFVFKLNNGKLETCDFFYSKYYNVHNWFVFITFGIIPSILLLSGNTYLVYLLHRFKKVKAKCYPSSCMNNKNNKKQRDYTNLTTTLILIIFFFLITEIPYLLVSRTSAVTFFFANSSSRECNTKTLELVREIVTVINAISLAADFLMYYIFCPAFYKVLTKIVKRPLKKRKKSIRKLLDIFVIDRYQYSGEKCTDKNVKSSMDDDGYCCVVEDVANRKTVVTLC